MKITDSRFGLAEHRRNLWTVMAEPGTKPADLLKPDAWAHVAARLRPGDKIEVVTEDYSLYVELLVIKTGRGWAQVKGLGMANLAEQIAEEGAPEGSEHEVVWRGPRKWSVIRKADKEVLKEDLATREDAATWLRSHELALVH